MAKQNILIVGGLALVAVSAAYLMGRSDERAGADMPLESVVPAAEAVSPTGTVDDRDVYYPGTESIGPDEMRISFCGSTPYPPREDQAGTCIMVELGNGERFCSQPGRRTHRERTRRHDVSPVILAS